MATGYVISDLHLFSPWSVARRYAAEMHAAAERAAFFVLNGDIFDFRWTTLPSVTDTITAAVRWLRAFAAAHPRCHVHYVMGNHDDLASFVSPLNRLAARTENFGWDPVYVRLADTLFMHGDQFFRPNGRDPFTRTLTSRVRKRAAALKRCYQLLHRMRVHRWHAPVLGKRRCARLVLRTLDAAPDDVADGLTDVYFGHTHTSFTDFRFRGVTFHNTGSAIGGLRWRMLPVQIEG